ncbi:MAG: condensation domain-containing protein, partial [Bacteroidota bacterium]
MQKYIWLDQQLDIQSPKYNIGGYAIINGKLDTAVFKQAVVYFAEKHSILKSMFKEEQGIPLMYISGEEIENKVLYFENYDKEEVLQLIQNDFKIPFDINRAEKLCTIWLFKVDADTFIWYTKLHHLIADGFSFQLLFNEIGTIYSSLVTSQFLEEKHPQKDFLAHVQEEKEYYNSDHFIKDKEYWVDRYNSFPELIFNDLCTKNILYDKELILSADSYLALQKLAKREQLSEFHLLLASFSIVLSKFYHKEEINIGTPIFNRTSREDRQVFGPFINLLSLQMNVDGETSILELARKIKKDTFSIYRHQKFQQAELIKAIAHTGSRLYDFRISYENFDYQKTFSGYDAEIIALSNHSENDPMSVHIMNYNNEGLKFRFDFNGSYIPEYIAKEFIASLKHTMDHLIDLIHDEIGQISVCTQEQNKEINIISRGAIQADNVSSFNTLWRKNVELYSSNSAILFKEETLSYFEVDKKVQNIAAYLQKNHVGKGDRVGLLLDRSVNIIPAILGILQAGATYVPIDKSFPKERIAFIIQDSRIKILLTDEECSLDYPQVTVETILREEELPAVEIIPISPDDDAYIIYTSGSTGKPKGVLIKHESLLDYATTFSGYFKLHEADNVIQQSSFVFDTSIEEIFPILSVGGSLVISENPKDFHNLLQECSQYQVTLLSTNPYVAQYLNDNYHKYDLSLKILISGGEIGVHTSETTHK